MSNNTQPPFRIGQKVVCVKKGRRTAVVGREYTIADVEQCKCGIWYVYVLEIADPDAFIPFSCEKCPRLKYSQNGLARCRHEIFAPIEPRHQNAEIAADLLKDPVKETLDVPKINEPILS